MRKAPRAKARAVKARRAAKAPRKASRPAARKAKKCAAGGTRARKAPARAAVRKPSARSAKGSETFGERNWKADEQYRDRLRKFSKTHDVEALARQAALDLEPDLRESDDGDVADSARRGAEEEPEW